MTIDVQLNREQIELLRKLGLPDRLSTRMDDDLWCDIQERLLEEVQLRGLSAEDGENEYGLLCSSVYMAMVEAEEIEELGYEAWSRKRLGWHD